jgi:rhodanese-related sulfurtransferase
MHRVRSRHNTPIAIKPTLLENHGSSPTNDIHVESRKENAMASTVKEMLSAANAAVPRVAPAELRDMMQRGEVLVVDVRDQPELASAGKVKGAVNVSRGMLEFRADPESPYHNAVFQKDKAVALYCASGGRSALAGKTLKELGYKTVYNAGAFKELAEAGLPTEAA